MVLAVTDDRANHHPISAIVRSVEPWQAIVSCVAAGSVYGLGLVFIYLDLVYDRLGAAGAQPAMPQADVWPRAVFWGTLHVVGLMGCFWSFLLARHAHGIDRTVGAQLGLVILVLLVGAGATRFAGGVTFIALSLGWLLAFLLGMLRKPVTLVLNMSLRIASWLTKPAQADEGLSQADAWRVLGRVAGLMLFVSVAFAGYQASAAAKAIQSDRRPDSYFVVLPIRRVDVNFTDDRVAQALKVQVNTLIAATLLGQRDGRFTLLLRSDRRVVDVPTAAAVLTSRR